MKETVTRNAVPQSREEAGLSNAQQRPGFPLRSLRTLQDGNENGGQFFAFDSHSPKRSRPFGLPVYVAPLPAGSILVATARAFPR